MKPGRLKGIAAASLLLFSAFSFAQEVPETIQEDAVEDKIEDVINLSGIPEGAEVEVDYSTLLDNIEHFRENRINLNNTTREELQELSLLDEIQINAFLTHIGSNGKLLSIYELQSIDGFDLETIFKILPYVHVTEEGAFKKLTPAEVFRKGRHSVILRYQRVLEEQEGFLPHDESSINKLNSRYLGDPSKIYMKYRFTYGTRVSFGFVTDKDAGEVFLPAKPSGPVEDYSKRDSVISKYNLHKQAFDFYSAHVFVKNVGFMKALAIGDYQVQYGQGITLWSGLSFGKSSEIMTIKKNAAGIKPYTSAGESVFMRGIATSLGYKKFSVDLFYSSKYLDGNITSRDTIDDQVLNFSSFQETGLHRTPSELEDKHSIYHRFAGTHLGYRSKRLSLGMTGFNSEYGADLVKTTYPYNQFDFNGRQNIVGGFDYSYVAGNFFFFGEAAQSRNGGRAFINGALVSLDAKVSVAVLHRSYDKDYQSLFSNGIAEGSKTQNEKGTYMGMHIRPARAWSFAGYYDLFSFPWLKYQVDAPSSGYEYIAQITHNPKKTVEFYIRYKETVKQKNSSVSSNPVSELTDIKQQNVRFNVAYKVSPSITLKSRVEASRYDRMDKVPSNGFMLYQDVTYKMSLLPASISARYVLFDTDTYDSRIYAYESDLLYVYSVPAYNYRGSKYYIMLKYRIKKGIDLWLRYSETVYNNKLVFGSGLDLINGKSKSEIKAQLRFSF